MQYSLYEVQQQQTKQFLLGHPVYALIGVSHATRLRYPGSLKGNKL
jgi:hypothetical protein